MTALLAHASSPAHSTFTFIMKSYTRQVQRDYWRHTSKITAQT